MLVKARVATVKFAEKHLPVVYKASKSFKKTLSNYARVQNEKSAFKKDFEDFSRLTSNSDASQTRFKLSWERKWPIMDEKTKTTGFDRHYVFFVAWAVRKVREIAPKVHVDMSSSLHFCTTLSAFIPVKFYDYRPANVPLSNLESGAADLTDLKNFEDNSVESLSCMHVVEHIGLGRYGDPLDPDGDIKAIKELTRVLAKGGDLLFVVPMGQSEIRYNAHRLYSYDQVVSLFGDLTLHEFTLIPDDEAQGQVVENATKELADKQSYACGCFWFKKI